MKEKKAVQRILLWIDGGDMVRPGGTVENRPNRAGGTDSRVQIVSSILK